MGVCYLAISDGRHDLKHVRDAQPLISIMADSSDASRWSMWKKIAAAGVGAGLGALLVHAIIKSRSKARAVTQRGSFGQVTAYQHFNSAVNTMSVTRVAGSP